MTLAYFVDIVKRDHPEWPLTAVYWQARRMQQRDPVIRKAVNAGLREGRDLRERMQHGVGVWWDEMEGLTPDERGFVLALVRVELGLKPAGHTELGLVREAQEAEAYEANADALADEWAAKRARPDKRVTLVGSFRDLLRRRPA